MLIISNMEIVGSNLKIIMPVTMLGLTFLLKLWVVNVPKAPDYLKALIELPVSISLLSVAMFISYSITVGVNGKQHSDGIAFFALALFITLIVIAIWRGCCILFNKECWFALGLCSIGNYALAVSYAIFSIVMVAGV